MGVVRTGNTAFDKEVARWNRPKHELDDDGVPGMNASGFEPFPAMLYKAHRRENGKVMCMDMDALYASDLNTVNRAEAFNASCMLVVNSQIEKDRALDNGWRTSPQAALDYQESLARDIAKASAEVNYGVQRMSEQARAEHRALDAATEDPVADVPAPAKKRGRKPNQPMVTVS